MERSPCGVTFFGYFGNRCYGCYRYYRCYKCYTTSNGNIRRRNIIPITLIALIILIKNTEKAVNKWSKECGKSVGKMMKTIKKYFRRKTVKIVTR